MSMIRGPLYSCRERILRLRRSPIRGDGILNVARESSLKRPRLFQTRWFPIDFGRTYVYNARHVRKRSENATRPPKKPRQLYRPRRRPTIQIGSAAWIRVHLIGLFRSTTRTYEQRTDARRKTILSRAWNTALITSPSRRPAGRPMTSGQVSDDDDDTGTRVTTISWTAANCVADYYSGVRSRKNPTSFRHVSGRRRVPVYFRVFESRAAYLGKVNEPSSTIS